MFYFVSYPAHKDYPDKHITFDKATKEILEQFRTQTNVLLINTFIRELCKPASWLWD